MKNKVILKVDECAPFTLVVSDEPQSEKELLKYSQYVKWYWKIGLGALVSATVYVRKSLFKTTRYSFDYVIKGNAMSLDDFSAVLEKYMNFSKCESLHSILDQGIMQYVYSFDSKEKAMQLCGDLDKICNIGSWGEYHANIRKYIVRIEYHVIQ